MMKRIGQIAVTLALIFLIPSGFASGQEKKEEKHIKIIISDKGGEKIIIDTTIVATDADGNKTVRIVNGEPIVIMNGDDGEKVVIVKSGSHVSDGEVKYNIEVNTDESGNKTENTSYVIAKDGMVVTIEGGSEEKVKELAGVIESKLGVKKDDKSSKTEVVKEETKKTTKK
jgi:hypothetical protein